MEFHPSLRFAVMSDIHLKDCPSVERLRLRRALDVAAAFAAADKLYPHLDALCVVGDFTDNGTEIQLREMKQILDAHLPSETKRILSMAGHDYFTHGIEPAQQMLRDIFGVQPDCHEVINGYHFISMSSGKSDTAKRDGFDEAKRAFYRGAVAAAERDHPSRPIFTFQHPHPSNTCYGSAKTWGTPDLLDIQRQHPRLFVFSGHSHAPINDPRSVDQQDFTSVNTGTMKYFELDEFDKVYGTCPPGQELAAQFHIVEADASGRVRLIAYDLITDRPFGEPVLLGPDWRKDAFTCTDARPGSGAVPYFRSGDRISIVSAGRTSVTFRFPQAQIDAFRVNAYYASVLNADGIEEKRESIWSGYYFNDMPPVLHWRIEGLKSDTPYTLALRAESFWHRLSAPLCAPFTTATE